MFETIGMAKVSMSAKEDRDLRSYAWNTESE